MRVVISPCCWCGKEDTGILAAFDPSVTGAAPCMEPETRPGYRVAG